MSSSKLLEQAIVDAQALRDSAFKSAQATLLEKFAPQVKEAVEKLLEQDEEPQGLQGSPEDAFAAEIPPGTDFGGPQQDPSNKSYVSGKAKDIPRAALDGEKLCPCPDDNEEVTLELNLADLADQLMVGKEAEEDEDTSMEPQSTGMMNQPQAAGGTGLTENLELEEVELEEDLELEEVELKEMMDEDFGKVQGEQLGNSGVTAEQLTEVDLDEVLSEEENCSEEAMQEGTCEEEQSIQQEKKLSPKNQKLAAKYGDPNEITHGDIIAAVQEKKNKKTNESTVKQLMNSSVQLLKEHQNTVKLVEKKDAQIQKILEENKKFSSTIEEMSKAFKKLEEVNLLNAHLFYQNQVLKSASLNERQKTHIVEAISKADSVNEAKAVYETLINSMGGPAEKERSPKSLNEAINKTSSFRLPHKQAEQPNDPNKDRWLKLAGIK